ncbi:MAG: class I SAM-dependent methyltransferase [Deltaproteobacteria bacterium]|nr:class I SAM-dependent methyltransferase [Deltaproteobacteria bacterium]
MKRSLFDTIAPAYNIFFGYQVSSFKTILSRTNGHLVIPREARVLDIGCGTGALAFCLREMGYRVTGVDASSTMIGIAKKNNPGNAASFMVANALHGLPFADRSFDLVISSYVAHGLPAEQRKAFFTEAKRLARMQVIFQDYNKKRKPLSDIVEWLEGGNYFSFIEHGRDEMKGVFSTVEMRSFAAQVAWYICTP